MEDGGFVFSPAHLHSDILYVLKYAQEEIRFDVRLYKTTYSQKWTQFCTH